MPQKITWASWTRNKTCDPLCGLENELVPSEQTYQEHSAFVPYCDVQGICALRNQMAGMSPLKAVEFVRGMENSRRKTFWAPEKPSSCP